jgi:hypothetical protein
VKPTVRLVDRAWPLWLQLTQPWLQSMADGSGGRFLEPDIEAALVRGEYQLWPVMRNGECVAALVTQIMHYPRLKACRMIGCAGRDMREWVPLHPQIVAWAARQGCTKMEALCRPGWGRVLAPLGYSPFHVLIEGDVHAPVA